MFPLVLFGIVGLAAAGFATASVKRIQNAWTAAATDLGFDIVPGGVVSGPRLHGTLRGITIEVDIENRGNGDTADKYTRYRLGYPPGPVSITLSKQNIGSVFKRFFGGRDVLIGDPGFDERVMIDAQDPIHASQFLSPARRLAVLSLFESWDKATITQASILVERRGVETDSQRLATNVRRLADLALVMSAPTEVDFALQKQQDGDLQDAVDSLHKVNDSFVSQGESNSFTQLLEAEALVTLGDGAAAAEILEDVSTSVGVDDEVAGWQEAAKAHPSPIQDEVRADAEPSTKAPTTAPEASLEQHEVINDLFASNRFGYETEGHFSSTYAGRSIQWSGTVDKAREATHDTDFAGAGLKTTVLLGNLGDGRLLSGQVNAIVYFPPETAVSRGETINFAGTLTKADRYMRNIFVANARLANESAQPSGDARGD